MPTCTAPDLVIGVGKPERTPLDCEGPQQAELGIALARLDQFGSYARRRWRAPLEEGINYCATLASIAAGCWCYHPGKVALRHFLPPRPR